MNRRFLLWIPLLAICVLSTRASAAVAPGNLPVVNLAPLSKIGPVFSFTHPMSLHLDEKAGKVTMSYAEDVQDLLLSARRDGFLKLHVHTSFLNDALSSEGLLMYNGLETKATEEFDEDQQRLTWFRLQKKQGRLSYGAEYFYIGKDFTTPTQRKDVKDITGAKLGRDREGATVWGKWQFGVLSMKASLMELWNNVDSDPKRPRFTTTRGGIALDLAPPSWPILSVSYTRGPSESSREPKDFLPQTYTQDAVDVSISYGTTSWYAMLTSIYSLETSNLQTGEKHLQLYHGLSIAYYPTHALYAGVDIDLTKATSWPYYVQTTTPSVTFSLTYGRLFDRFDLEANGYYEKTKSTDGLVNTSTIALKTGVVFTTGHFCNSL